jgi:hypothetical protein
VDKKDLLTFVGAIFFVLVIALAVNPPDFSSQGSELSQNSNHGKSMSDYCIDSSCCYDNLQYTYIVERTDPPYVITYNTNLDSVYAAGANGYPRLRLPGNDYAPAGDYYAPDKYANNQPTNMDGFTTSDIFSADIWGKNSNDTMTFAYMEGDKSGFSTIFGVPYPLWRINCTMVPEGNPAYSRLMWVLVDSATGDVITGGNIFPEGSIMKEVSVANREMYFIIEARNVQSFALELQTPVISYKNKYPKPAEGSLTDFLNTIGD